MIESVVTVADAGVVVPTANAVCWLGLVGAPSTFRSATMPPAASTLAGIVHVYWVVPATSVLFEPRAVRLAREEAPARRWSVAAVRAIGELDDQEVADCRTCGDRQCERPSTPAGALDGGDRGGGEADRRVDRVREREVCVVEAEGEHLPAAAFAEAPAEGLRRDDPPPAVENQRRSDLQEDRLPVGIGEGNDTIFSQLGIEGCVQEPPPGVNPLPLVDRQVFLGQRS